LNKSLRHKLITSCRVCNNPDLQIEIRLGSYSSCGLFLQRIDSDAPSGELNLIRCNNCNLIQLDRNFDLEELFKLDYGYATALNNGMKTHIENLVKEAHEFLGKPSTYSILDIGSNDGTLLNFTYSFSDPIYAVGVDPNIVNFESNYDSRIFKISEFFDLEQSNSLKRNISKRFDLITSIAMFYDLPNPDLFVKGVKNLLNRDGIWILELSYFYSMIESNAIDTVCHEHLEYYSCESINFLLKRNELKVIHFALNQSNGGSMRLYVSHINSKFHESSVFINTLARERNLNTQSEYKLLSLKNRATEQISKALEFLSQSRFEGVPIYALGASTKGNLILQMYPELSKKITSIGEVNISKFGKFTPGSLIQIVDENSLFGDVPAIFIIMPWHFKENLIEKYRKLNVKKNNYYLTIFPDFDFINF
jgi:SAM-dependent methyltransferase